MSEVRQDIESIVADYRDCWARLDFERLRGLWDTDDAEPLYVAEEAAAPMLDWPAIEAYWRSTRAATESIRISTSNLCVRALGDRLASAVYDMRWVGRFRTHPRPIGGELRVAAMFRHKPAGWRFLHYVEAPLAPIVYFRRSYERFAEASPSQDAR